MAVPDTEYHALRPQFIILYLIRGTLKARMLACNQYILADDYIDCIVPIAWYQQRLNLQLYTHEMLWQQSPFDAANTT